MRAEIKPGRHENSFMRSAMVAKHLETEHTLRELRYLTGRTYQQLEWHLKRMLAKGWITTTEMEKTDLCYTIGYVLVKDYWLTLQLEKGLDHFEQIDKGLAEMPRDSGFLLWAAQDFL